MSIVHIQDKVKQVLDKLSRTNFIYDLLLAYNTPKATIARLQKGTSNLAKGKGEVLLKTKLYFKEVLKADLHASIDKIMHDSSILKFYPRFIIVTDFNTILSVDTKIKDTLDIPFKELPKNFDFFLPWAGMEKSQITGENPVDIKAAYKMAILYDLIRHDNPGLEKDKLHELNVFLSRLLFCFFAEDTEIFESKLFSNSIDSHTQEDGSDLSDYLTTLFEVLNTKDNQNYPAFLQKFPYVNGGLFGHKIKVPKFSRKSRKMIIECGAELNWAKINPDIFGSMMQAVVHPDQRHGMGMHYTSVINIMKVIEPLFLNELKEEFDNHYDNKAQLKSLLKRLTNLKFFDPACGSGNFLIIAFKEIRKLEIEILNQLQAISGQGEFSLSNIRLSQFYGIEIDDFAHEIAILSLWLADHQMNLVFKEEFGQTRPSLPLKESGKIICGNALRLDWEEVCPKGGDVYVLGNPPYLGARLQSYDQKNDMKLLFEGIIKGFNNLDYISCWFYKGYQYISDGRCKVAFVSTNSICQGSQISLLWPNILKNNHEIDFAYQSFKWINNARSNAGVTCVIVGLRLVSDAPKYIFIENIKHKVSNISPYLTDRSNRHVVPRRNPLSNLPFMCFGSMPNDGGYFIVSQNEYDDLKNTKPRMLEFIRPMFGGQEFIKGIKRYCIWIEESNLKDALAFPFIKDRIEKVRNYREGSKREATRKLSKEYYKFAEIRYKDTQMIIVPATSSERREYLPMGFLKRGIIVTNSANAIYDAEPYIFGLISSKMHVLWVKAVGGQLETRIRYSAEICYNTFPIPELSQKQKDIITTHVFNVLGEREKFSQKTISELYDPAKMPKGLREAHRELDEVVEHCYRYKSFGNDEERLEHLFKLYEELIKKEELCLT